MLTLSSLKERTGELTCVQHISTDPNYACKKQPKKEIPLIKWWYYHVRLIVATIVSFKITRGSSSPQRVHVLWLRSYWAGRNGEFPVVSDAQLSTCFHQYCIKSIPAKSLSRAAAELHWLQVSAFPTVPPIYRGHSSKELRFLQWPNSEQEVVEPCKTLFAVRYLSALQNNRSTAGDSIWRENADSVSGHELRINSLPRKATSQKKEWDFEQCVWNEHCFTHFSTIVYQDTTCVYMGPV